MYATIQPVSPGWPAKTADKLRVSNVQINTIGQGGNAQVRWQLYSDAGSVVEGTNTLAGAAYDAWGAHDAYLLEWLAGVLGLTIVEIVPDAPAPADTVPAVTEAVPAVDDPAV